MRSKINNRIRNTNQHPSLGQWTQYLSWVAADSVQGAGDFTAKGRTRPQFGSQVGQTSHKGDLGVFKYVSNFTWQWGIVFNVLKYDNAYLVLLQNVILKSSILEKHLDSFAAWTSQCRGMPWEFPSLKTTVSAGHGQLLDFRCGPALHIFSHFIVAMCFSFL